MERRAEITQEQEDQIESAYWAFDAERKKTGSERDAFKGQMRKILRAATPRTPRSRAMSERVERIKQLMEQGNPSPWSLAYVSVGLRHLRKNVDIDAFMLTEEENDKFFPNEDDAELICALRNAAPALLAVVEASEEVCFGHNDTALGEAIDALKNALRELEREGES